MDALEIIGPHTTVSLPREGVSSIPAKVDTGAYTSSIWASDIQRDDDALSFVLFGEGSPFYTGKRITVTNFTQSRVKSSFGASEVRYKITLDISIDGVSFTTQFTLANRHRNRFPILVGRQALRGRFVVDVSRREALYIQKKEA